MPAVFEDAVDGARQRLRTPGKSLNRRLARLAAQTVEAAAVGSQPKSPLGILRDRGDGIVGEPLLHGGVNEIAAVQAAQAARSPNPKITLAGAKMAPMKSLPRPSMLE